LETVKGLEVKKAEVVTPPKDAQKKPDAPK
jgi:hypothetical protein